MCFAFVARVCTRSPLIGSQGSSLRFFHSSHTHATCTHAHRHTHEYTQRRTLVYPPTPNTHTAQRAGAGLPCSEECSGSSNGHGRPSDCTLSLIALQPSSLVMAALAVVNQTKPESVNPVDSTPVFGVEFADRRVARTYANFTCSLCGFLGTIICEFVLTSACSISCGRTTMLSHFLRALHSAPDEGNWHAVPRMLPGAI